MEIALGSRLNFRPFWLSRCFSALKKLTFFSKLVKCDWSINTFLRLLITLYCVLVELIVALGWLEMALCFLFINFATFVKFLPTGSIVDDIEKLFVAPAFDTGLVVVVTLAADTSISYSSLGLNKSKYFCYK